MRSYACEASKVDSTKVSLALAATRSYFSSVTSKFTIAALLLLLLLLPIALEQPHVGYALLHFINTFYIGSVHS